MGWKMRFITVSMILTGTLIAVNQSAAGKIIYFDEIFPQTSAKFNAELKNELITKGYKLNEVSGTQISKELDSIKDSGNILVMSDSRYLPVDAKSSLISFLKKKNHLIAISGPSFSRIVIPKDGKWLSKEEFVNSLIEIPGESILNFGDHDPSKWDRNVGIKQSSFDLKIEPSGRTDIPDALHVKIDKLDKWDMILGSKINLNFPKGTEATAFWAKGRPDTPELAFEWREKDNSRWMASVELTTEWKRYVLLPEDFRFWPDNPPAGRGGPDDKFNPANALHCSIGLSEGITKQKTGVAHEYWISDVRGIANEIRKYDLNQPIIETLSPHYKTYESEIKSFKDIGTGRMTAADTTIVSPIPRARGLGMDALRKWRFIPVAEGYEDTTTKRGIAAHLMLHNTDDFAGSIMGYTGFSQEYLNENGKVVLPLIIKMIDRINKGLFLANAGTEHFAYTDDEKIKYGAHIINLSDKNDKIQFEIIITDRKNPYRFRNKPIDLPSNNLNSPVKVSLEHPMQLLPGNYLIKSRLIKDGKAIDEIDHSFNVISYKPVTDRNTVLTKGNDFYLNEKKWYPLGINYWPSTANGTEDGEESLFFLQPERYDPDLIERELSIIESLDMNTVSIVIYNEAQCRSLMDFMERAKQHKLKVHLYVPGLFPVSHDFQLAEKLIKAAHLPETESLFSYDLGWEVHLGYYKDRIKFDKDWQNWVIDRYGSIESAAADWGYKPETVNDVITGPKDEQLTTDGEWRTYVAAYRRFMDDHISKGYQQVRDFIRSLDSKHLMGARSGWAGQGSMWAVPGFPFDLLSGAKHLDYTSPEGYAVGGDNITFLEGGFDNAYCLYVSNNKPICWVEYASGTWGFNIYEYKDYDDETTQKQIEYYRNLLKMTYDTFANGSLGWWYPAGTRLGEESDLGLIKPDGRIRPAAKEITKAVKWFHRDADIPAPNHYITINRDKYVTGYAGIRAEHVKQYVDAFREGKIPGIRTEGTGTTSINTPLIAIGDNAYNGNNPPKYLNAEFNWIKINGKTIKENSEIKVNKDSPIIIEASVGNTAEAKWISSAAKEDGTVHMIIESNSDRVTIPITKDTEFLKDAHIAEFKLSDKLNASADYVFRMTALNRMDFGEVLRVTVIPE